MLTQEQVAEIQASRLKNPIDQARYFLALKNGSNVNIKEIAEASGIPYQDIRSTLQLLHIPQEDQNAVAAGFMSVNLALLREMARHEGTPLPTSEEPVKTDCAFPVETDNENEGSESFIVEHNGAMWSFATLEMALKCCDRTWGPHYGPRSLEEVEGDCMVIKYGIRTEKYINIRRTVTIDTVQALIY